MKEDAKQIIAGVLFIFCLIFGTLCAIATYEVVKEEGFDGFIIGSTITVLLLIPAWYIGRHIIYANSKEFFDNLFK